MKPIRVLIVDDEDQFVEAVTERLRLRGLEADGATGGQEAMERLQESSYDVVLLDVKMPGLGGFEIIRKVKEEWPGMQVVLLTGHASTQDAEEGKRLGAFEYVMKPVNIDDLTGIIRASLQSGEADDG